MTTGGVMVGLAGIQDNLFRPLRSDLIRIGPHKKDWGTEVPGSPIHFTQLHPPDDRRPASRLVAGQTLALFSR